MRRKRSLVEQLAHALGVLVEELHPHAAVFTVRGLRPPRTAVVTRVGRKRAVHVGGDLVHHLGVEPPAQMQEAGFAEERGDVVVIVFGRERAVQVERGSVAVLERHRAAGVHRPLVDQRAQHHPPVEEVAEVAADHAQRARGQERHRRLQVVDDVGDVAVGELHHRDAVGAGLHRHRRVVERERPRSRRRRDRERLDAQLPRAGDREHGAFGDQRRELLVEERPRVDRP